MVPVQIQKYFSDVASGRRELRQQSRDPHTHWSRDYGDYVVTGIKLSKTDPYGGPNRRVNGRRLYNVTLRRRK